MSLNNLLNFAVQTAYDAGRLTLSYFQSSLEINFKLDNSPVTLADKKAEELIRMRIEKAYPEHSIVGEEFGEVGNAPIRWFIDPIDGTKSFMRGVPLYAVLIGLEIEGKVEVGAVYFPALDEMLYAATSMGSYLNGRQVQVSPINSLDKAIISYTDGLSFEGFGKQAPWQRLQKAVYACRGWSDAYGHALVATGRCEAMLDPIMNTWDCAPFLVILSEAKGYCGNWVGEKTMYSQELLSCNDALLPRVLELINNNT